MRKRRRQALEIEFLQCAAITTAGGAHDAVAIAQQAGGEFIDGDLRPNPNPFRYLNKDGNLIPSTKFRHPYFQPDRCFLDDLRLGYVKPDTMPWGGLGFIGKGQQVSIHQDADLDDLTVLDRIALGQLQLACELYPRLQPMYGWIDEAGLNVPKAQHLTPEKLDFVFWANFFSPDWVRHIGADFLSEAPGWRTVHFPDGGRLYVTAPSYAAWEQGDHEEVRQYFRSKFPQIDIYRAEEIDLW